MLLHDANHVIWYLYFFDTFHNIFEKSHVKRIILYIINWGLQFKLTFQLARQITNLTWDSDMTISFLDKNANVRLSYE